MLYIIEQRADFWEVLPGSQKNAFEDSLIFLKNQLYMYAMGWLRLVGSLKL